MSEEEKENKPKGNPVMDMLDKVLVGARKFLEEQKLLKMVDELSYLAIRKTVDFLKGTFIPMKIEGNENVPDFKPAILTTIADQPIDMFLVTALSPRKIHLMLPYKMFQTPGLKPLLESIGAYRSTKDKDDMEPIQQTLHLLNEKQDLVAMIPIDDGEREKLVKTFGGGIVKIASGVGVPIIPYVSTPLKYFKLGKEMKFNIGEPIMVKSRLSRDERYAIANDMVDKLLKMKEDLRDKPEEEE
ncbi:MAG: lysophospholipid acyltransferase family protein [Candidatus Hodarchaeota archaeon]